MGKMTHTNYFLLGVEFFFLLSINRRIISFRVLNVLLLTLENSHFVYIYINIYIYNTV